MWTAAEFAQSRAGRSERTWDEVTAIPVCLGLRQGPLAGFLALPLPMLALSSLAGRPGWGPGRRNKV